MYRRKRRDAARGDARAAAVSSGAGSSFTRSQTITRRAPRQALRGPAHGQVRGDVWRKSVRGSVHMLRTPRAWCFDVGDLGAAEAVGVRLVLVHDLESLRKHYATIATVRARGFALDRGHGRQVALALEHWRPTPQEAEAAAPEPEPEGPRQLALFEAVR